MSKLRLRIAVSLDGFVAGPSQSVKDPLGIGGMRLHQWMFALDVWQKVHDQTGGEHNASSEVLEQAQANIGATLIGRNMFGGHPGPWDASKPWNGWWGEVPPFHHPVFVVTHHPREPLVLADTTFTFVTSGLDDALAQAKRAAGSKDVTLAGGGSIAAQYLAKGVVDEMLIHQVPILLGSGERLLQGLGDDLRGLELVETVATPQVTHLRFARR